VSCQPAIQLDINFQLTTQDLTPLLDPLTDFDNIPSLMTIKKSGEGYINTRFLWFLTLSYTMILIFVNLFDPRIVNIFGWITDAGTLIFPLTFLLSDLITEVYGYKPARQAIWIGFMFNAIFIIYGQIVIHLPNPPYPTHNDLFTTLFTLDRRIILASAFSYLCSEPLNSYILSKLKVKTRGKFISLRFVVSTTVGSGIDSCIFGVAAFASTMSNYNLLLLILTMWTIKIIIEICGLPLTIKLAKTLKKAEKIDVYDTSTKFNLFSLDVSYLAAQNAYSTNSAE
jgi:queuosine precursor transporter